jgi:general secretion pathway protein H
MGKQAARIKMPMLAAGSDLMAMARLRCLTTERSRGFTLIELMVVITLIAIATAGVSFAIRDSESTLLDREADRLSSVLESARVQSRSSGVAIAWVALPQGFALIPAQQLQRGRAAVQIDASSVSPWLAPGMVAQIQEASKRVQQPLLLLGSEPMIAPASVVLSLGERQLRVATDGLRPFAVQPMDESARP